jgi:phage gpG-like protein
MAVRGDFDRLGEMVELFDRLADGSALQRLAQKVGQEALELVDVGFERGRSPTGRRWAEPKYRRGPPLILTGRLRRSFALRMGHHRFEIVSELPYAYRLQHGPEPRKMVPNEADISARWDRALRESAHAWAREIAG